MKEFLETVFVFLIRLLLPVYFLVFRKVRKVDFAVKGLKAPYFLVCNHQATLDPFFLGVNLPGPISFVATDMLFRVPIMNFLLTTIGTIPKSKFSIDSQAVRGMMRAARNGRAIAIFPEGQRCIAGYTEPLVPGIGKLAKLLDVPVVAGKLKGGFLVDPFWSRRKRKGTIEMSAGLLIDRERLRSMDSDEVEAEITAALEHSDHKWIKSRHELRFTGKERAKGLYNVMYLCPECSASDSFGTEGDIATCRSCGYSISWNDKGSFDLVKGSRLHFPDIEQHDRWQRVETSERARLLVAAGEQSPVLGPQAALVRRSRKAKPLAAVGMGRISLMTGSMILESEGVVRELPLRNIQGFAISAVRSKFDRMFEFIDTDGILYNLTLEDPYESTYKWLLTFNALKAFALTPKADGPGLVE